MLGKIVKAVKGLGSGLVSGIAGNVAGGLLSDRSQRRADQAARQWEDPANIVARYEAAGVNPLLHWQGGNAPVYTARPSYMGAAIADSAGLIGQALQQRQDKARESKLEMKNQALERQLKKETARPHMPGVFENVSARNILRNTTGSDPTYERGDEAPRALVQGDGGLFDPVVTSSPTNTAYRFGFAIDPDPRFSDMETGIEARRGDPFWIESFAQGVADVMHTWRQDARGESTWAKSADGIRNRYADFAMENGVFPYRDPDGFEGEGLRRAPYWDVKNEHGQTRRVKGVPLADRSWEAQFKGVFSYPETREERAKLFDGRWPNAFTR